MNTTFEDVIIYAFDPHTYELMPKYYRCSSQIMATDVYGIGTISYSLLFNKEEDIIYDENKIKNENGQYFELCRFGFDLLSAKIKFILCSVISLEEEGERPFEVDDVVVKYITNLYDQYCDEYPELVIKLAPEPNKYNYFKHIYFWDSK